MASKSDTPQELGRYSRARRARMSDKSRGGLMKFIAKFTPQAWVRDYAVDVDPEGPTEWEVTDWMRGLPSDEVRQGALNQESEPWDFNDELRDHPAAPQWIKEWSGPFEIHVREERTDDRKESKNV